MLSGVIVRRYLLVHSALLRTRRGQLWPRTGEAHTCAGFRGGEIGGTAESGKPLRSLCEVSGGMRGDW